MVNGLPSNGVIFTVEADGSICPAASEQTVQGGPLNQGESFQLPFTMQPCEAVTFTILRGGPRVRSAEEDVKKSQSVGRFVGPADRLRQGFGGPP